MQEGFHVLSFVFLNANLQRIQTILKNAEEAPSSHSLTLCIAVGRVSQVYLAVDDRLASLKTDTFSKTREEKMEDLFAQKEVIDCLYISSP